MRWRLAILACAFFATVQGRGESARITLSNGVVSYTTEDGRRREIRVGKKCDDLWVSPDESVLAFIAIEKASPPTLPDTEPFIEESSIYIARKSEHFRAVRLALSSVMIDGRRWKVVRQPSVSPDLKTVYFLVPYTMTTWRLMSIPLAGNPSSSITDAMTYCVIWGGEYSGDLLIMRRQDSTPSSPPPGVTYPCYLRTRLGGQSVIVDGVTQECWDFDGFASRWCREHGGVCQP